MAGIQHVLHPTDLSVNSRHAFEHARLIAERFGARLTVYHALVPDVHLYDTEAIEKARGDAAESAVRAQLASFVQPIAVPHDIVVERNVIVPAFADAAVLGQIEHTQPDVTVMATHSRPGVSSYFVGTVTEQVVRLARQPVLVVRKGPGATVAPYRRILVTTDLSAASQSAFQWSRLLGARFSAEVVALNVAGSSSDSEQKAGEVRAFVAAHHEGVDLRVLVRQGRVWQEIVSAAQSVEADLIVMATRGHDSIGDDVFGSNTDRVLRSAPCPLLVVR